METCASNIKAQNKLYNSTRCFCYTFQIKIAIEPGAFHYTFWCHDQLLNFGKDISQDNFGRHFRNSQDKQNSHQGKDNSTQTKLVWVVVSDIKLRF